MGILRWKNKEEMRETVHNLHFDWEGLLIGYGISNFRYRQEIKKLIAFEIDAYFNQAWYKRLFKIKPKWNPFICWKEKPIENEQKN